MEQQSIKRKTVLGFIWKFLERILAQGISLIVSIVIARILDPSDYGVVAIITIFFNFANVLISGGFNSALIQKKDSDGVDYFVILVVSLILSVFIYFVLFFTAPIIAKAYDKEELVLIIRIMGLTLPITAVKSIWTAYISSKLLFRKFFFATLGGTLFSGAVGIVLAIKGYGPWALIIQQMTNTIIDTIILIATTRIKFIFRFSIQNFKSLFRYGWKVYLSSVISCVYSETVPLVIGIKYSSDDLSFYTKGRSFPNFLSSAITNTMSSVLFPTLSKFQDDKETLLRYTRRFINVASFLVFPVMLGFFSVSDTFVRVVLTEKWLPAVPYIRIFCIACMFDMIHIGNCETIKAMGKSGTYLVMEIIKKTGYFIIILLFTIFTDSPVYLAIAFIACTFLAIIVNSIPNIRIINYSLKNQLIDILPNLLIASIMCACCFLIGFIKINTILLLFIQILSGVIIYLGLSFVTRNKALRYLLELVKSNKNETAY